MADGEGGEVAVGGEVACRTGFLDEACLFDSWLAHRICLLATGEHENWSIRLLLFFSFFG